MRAHLGRFGQRGQSVTVFAEEGGVWLRLPGRVVKRFGDDAPATRRQAVAWAKKYITARSQLERERMTSKRLSLADLWTRYERANTDRWRPKTAADYAQYYNALSDHFGPAANMATLGLDDVDGFRAARRAKGIAHSQVRRVIGFLRQMLTWAEGRELIARNKLHAYRYDTPKDERGEAPGEYRREDVKKILAALEGPRHWRTRGVLALCGSLGARINAVLHLQWADVDLDKGTVTWRAAWDKLGKEGAQPLTPKARAALVEAWGQRHESEPWVFWAVRSAPGDGRRAHRSSAAAPKGRPIHYNTVWYALREAEKRAGVARLPGAFHKLRRMVVGDIGDLRLAGAWVRQASLKVTSTYDKARAEHQAEALARIAKAEEA